MSNNFSFPVSDSNGDTAARIKEAGLTPTHQKGSNSYFVQAGSDWEMKPHADGVTVDFYEAGHPRLRVVDPPNGTPAVSVLVAV